MPIGNLMAVVGGEKSVSPTDMRSNYTSLKGVAALCEITERGLKQTNAISEPAPLPRSSGHDPAHRPESDFPESSPGCP